MTSPSTKPAPKPKPKPAPMRNPHAIALRDYGLGLPEAWEDYPWGDRVLKVRKKIFLFFGGNAGEELGLGVKLPESRHIALSFEGATPAGYGLAASGWVSMRFAAGVEIPLEFLKACVAESYRAVAPKKLGAQVVIEHG